MTGCPTQHGIISWARNSAQVQVRPQAAPRQELSGKSTGKSFYVTRQVKTDSSVLQHGEVEWSVSLEFVAKAVARNFEIGKLQVDAEDENFHADHDM